VCNGHGNNTPGILYLGITEVNGNFMLPHYSQEEEPQGGEQDSKSYEMAKNFWHGHQNVTFVNGRGITRLGIPRPLSFENRRQLMCPLLLSNFNHN
jgi:hypothetical protein